MYKVSVFVRGLRVHQEHLEGEARLRRGIYHEGSLVRGSETDVHGGQVERREKGGCQVIRKSRFPEGNGRKIKVGLCGKLKESQEFP